MDQATSEKMNPQSTTEILQFSNGGMCVIPTAIFHIMLESMKLLAKSIEISGDIVKSLDVKVKPVYDAPTDVSSTDILCRLDNLTSAISSSTSALKGGTEAQRLQKDLKVRSTLFQKKLHAEKVSQLYHELLSEDTPFAPPKFRKHVSATAKESEKKYRRMNAIHRVQTEINIMTDNIEEWNDRISVIDGKRDTFPINHTGNELISKRIQKDEEKARKSVNRAILKLRHSYDEEKHAFPSTDFLLSTKNQQNVTYKRSRHQIRKFSERGGRNHPT